MLCTASVGGGVGLCSATVSLGVVGKFRRGLYGMVFCDLEHPGQSSGS